MLQAMTPGLGWPVWEFALGLAALLWAAGCSKEGPPSGVRLPEEFYGRWRLTGTSGGIAGGGAAATEDLILFIRPGNRIEVYREGRPESRIPFSVRRGRSIYTGKDDWLIERDPGGMAEVIRLGADGSLTLAENVYDGLAYTYQKAAD